MRGLLRGWVEATLLRGSDPARLARRRDRLVRLAVKLDDRLRQLTTARDGLPEIQSFDGRARLAISIGETEPPWAHTPLDDLHVPGMITREERRYYRYLASFYSGQGEVVELGPWLGLSTVALVGGLLSNPSFAGKRLHVFDDFVWRSAWMDKWLEGETEVRKPGNHGDFLPLFEHYTRGVAPHLLVEKRRIVLYDGNDAVPPLSWTGAPIEILVVDCGRTFEVNEAWYRTLSPSFIPGRTLLVLEDWKTHREVPVQWYNQTKQFTESKGRALRPLHELRDGGVATFLYLGNAR